MSKEMYCPLCGDAHENLEQHLQESHTQEELQQAFQPPEPPVQVQFSRAQNFSKHYAVDAYIETTPLDFRIYAVNEAQKQQGVGIVVENRIQEAAFILPPITAIALHDNLGKAISDYETQYGKINRPN